MRTFLKWLSAVFAVVVLMGFFFALYARFLVDYSLESLESAERIAERGAAKPSASSMQVYQNLMQNVLLDEASQEDANLRNLAFIQMASRSAAEETQGDFRARYRYYLDEVQKDKKTNRPLQLKFLDPIYRWIEKIASMAEYLWNYTQRKISPRRSTAVDLTSAVLLSQAESSEKNGDFDRAASLYAKYLERNPDHVDAGYTMLTLAGIKIKQKNWPGATTLLREVAGRYAGQEEAQIADDLLRRIEVLRRNWQELETVEKEYAAETQVGRLEKLAFKLGLLNLKLERFEESKKYMQRVSASADKNLQQKSRFYMGWVLKLQKKYDVSAEILSLLADDPQLDEELRSGIKAELADIFYQKGEAQKSLQQYQSLSGENCEEIQSGEVSEKTWAGLAELEQSFLYYNLGDGVKAGESLGCVVNLSADSGLVSDLKGASQNATGRNSQLVAFAVLQKGRVEQAREIFERSQKEDASNYLNYSGLAMVHLLTSKIELAEKSARQGYKLQKTEYSASVMGYVLAFQNQMDSAIAFYLQAVELDPEYFPARFNLACLYLKTRQYHEALKHLLELERSMKHKESLFYSKVLNNLGCALWWLGREDEAIIRLEEAVRVTPGYVDADLNLKQIKLERVPLPVTVPQLIQIEG